VTRLTAIQALRAIAAIAVTLAHVIGDITARTGVELVPRVAVGAAGVDLFFIISGFIMVYASRGLVGQADGWSIFLSRRLARIVPLYWLVTLIYLLMQIAQGKWQVVQLEWIVASLLFWPFPGVTGAGLSPFYGIGWTLNFEMMFYVVFSAALWLRRRDPSWVVASILAGGVALGVALPLPDLLRYWTNEIVLNFVFGIAIAVAFLRGVRLPYALGALLVALGVGGLIVSTWLGFMAALPDQPPAFPRSLAWGLPMALIMAGVALTVSPSETTPSGVARLLHRLGDASYSIYLVHPLVIVAMRPVLAASVAALAPLPAALLHLVLVAGLVVAASTVIFAAFERPLTAAILNRFARSGQANLPPSVNHGGLPQEAVTLQGGIATKSNAIGDVRD